MEPQHKHNSSTLNRFVLVSASIFLEEQLSYGFWFSVVGVGRPDERCHTEGKRGSLSGFSEGWIWPHHSAPPNVAHMSTLKRLWQQWPVVLKVSCVCSCPCTATMRPPCEIALVAPLFTWQLQWGKRPFWSGCWRWKILTWWWKTKNPAGLLYIVVLSTDRFTV